MIPGSRPYLPIPWRIFDLCRVASSIRLKRLWHVRHDCSVNIDEHWDLGHSSSLLERRPYTVKRSFCKFVTKRHYKNVADFELAVCDHGACQILRYIRLIP